MPDFIDRLLAPPLMPLIARILVTFLFWASGLFHLFLWDANVQGLAAQGWESPAYLNGAIVAVNLIGAGLIIQGRFAWLGAVGLMVFTLLTILLVHRFWAMQPPDSIPVMFTAWEHITVIGALFLFLVYDQRARRG